MERTAAILSIGDELLSGDVVDTNATWLDARLGRSGWPVRAHRAVPDDQGRVRNALRDLSANHALVIATGGLGPTDDDLTLAAVAAAAEVELRTHTPTLDRLRARAEARGRPMRPGHVRQAELPAGAEVVDNPIGSAPGLLLDVQGARVVVLPGVPTEMRALFELIEKRLPAGPAPSLRRVLGTVFIGESDLEARISKVRSAHPAVRFGFRSTGLVQQVRLYASDASALDDAAAAVLAELEGHAFGQGDDTLASALGARLTARGATVATAESCTGGMVGAALTEVPGSSTYYVGGVVAYANAVKVEALGVEPALLDVHGAVSEPVAIAMAAGARDRFGSDFAVSTTGVAGPGGGTEDKPVGLVWIGGAGPDGPWSKRLQVTGDRDTVRRRTVQHALAELWRRSV